MEIITFATGGVYTVLPDGIAVAIVVMGPAFQGSTHACVDECAKTATSSAALS
jgi:hypothetical protein